MLLCWRFGFPGEGAALRLENLALRHQLGVLPRASRRPRIRGWDRLFWIALKATWAGWRQARVIMRPEAVVGWHRRGFRILWRWKFRRRIGRPAIDRYAVHWNITESPITAWTAQHLVEAFPFDAVPEYLVRDRDAIHGRSLVQRVAGLGIKEKVIAPRSPWQNPIAERLIGSIRRECLDRVIVLNEQHLRRLLTDYCKYYHDARTHRSLGQDAPHPRAIEAPDAGKIVEFPMVGGLHHRYARRAA